MSQIQWKIETPTQPFYLVASNNGLMSVSTKKDSRTPMAATLDGSGEAQAILRQAVRELSEYFAGRRKTFSIPLSAEGTPFQKRVWQALQKIPYGETVSYRDLAKSIRNAKAFRAVGSANGKNPLCIVVPCHRVIAADGSLGGYSAGLELKKTLLRLEGSL